MSARLSVKELAGALRQSPWYVYKMRAAGFPMHWDEQSGCLVATATAARNWIRRHKFKIVRGHGVTTE